MRIIYIPFIVGLLLQSLQGASQERKSAWQDSLKLSIGTVATAASEDFQPFWLVANQFGTITDQQWDFSTNVRLENEHILNPNKWEMGNQHPLKLSYTFDVYNNNHFKDIRIIEGNMKLNWRGWQFRAGRYREVIGEVDSALSTGSWGISGNAMPIPKIGIAVPEYKPFPWTNGWLQFKGLFSHGWMGNERYLKDSWLHEKAFYLRAGRGKFKLFGGVAHFAEWGGRRDNVELDRSLRGFFDVLFVREANDGSVHLQIRPNRAGAQRGMLEFGVDWETELGYWHFYHQTPFESGTGIDIRNIDRVAGLNLKPKDVSSFWKNLLVEFIYTKQMEEFGRESQSYYTNGYYRTGWEYHRNVIGTPLLINRSRGSHFLPVEPYDWDGPGVQGLSNIVSNRIIGGHIGAEYVLWKKVRVKTMLTGNKHYMSRSPIRDVVNPNYMQYYTLQEFGFPVRSRLFVSGRIGYDFGDFYNNLGAGVGLKYAIGKL